VLIAMNTPEHRRGASGFTMLEVLISIVVIAFGLLGVAGLQAFALKNNQSASLRSVATVLATDMIDRIKANSKGATDGYYNETSSTAVAPASIAGCLNNTGCTSPQQLAQNDLFEWKAMVAAALPNGVGVVCLDDDIKDGANTGPADPKCSNTGNQLVIYIWWRDDRTRSNTTGALVRFPTQFQI
jgi:type IV pilus assembly protein PilV